MSQSLPSKPSLEHLKKQAKDLLKSFRLRELQSLDLFSRYFPDDNPVGLAEAQLVVAREYGFDSWADLKRKVDEIENPVLTFVDLAWSSLTDLASQMWKRRRPELRRDLAASAAAGDWKAVQAGLKRNPGSLNALLPPKNCPLLCYATFSRLALEPAFQAGVEEVVAKLIESGADPNAVYLAEVGGGQKWPLPALYGAAGAVNSPGLTKLLLDAGADPNDGDDENTESLYHSSEYPGRNECLRLILEANPRQSIKDYSFKHKLGYEDLEGARLYLEHGANPNANDPRTPLSHAVLRGRSVETLRLLLDFGADPNVKDKDGLTPYVAARRLGDKAAAQLMEEHGAKPEFTPEDEVLIAAADEDATKVRELIAAHPELATSFSGKGRQENDGMPLGLAGQMMHDMARLGQVLALKTVLELGMDPGQRNQWNEAPLHWGCVAGRPDVVRVLLDHGAPLDVLEDNHQSDPIGWAYWGSEYWNEPHGDYAATVEMMLDAGARLASHLEGSPAVQEVLKTRGVK